MKFYLSISSVLILAIFLITLSSCQSNDPDPNNNGNNPPAGELKIASLKNYTFWGENLTIPGTGFSSTKSENIIKFVNASPTTALTGLNYSSDGGDIEIVSASPTQLVIKVPVKVGNFADLGPDEAKIEITVGTKKITSDLVKFVGKIRFNNFCYFYGWLDYGVPRPGDSTILDLRIQGKYAAESGYESKLSLEIGNGGGVNIKKRTAGNCIGYAMLIPESFKSSSCNINPQYGLGTTSHIVKASIAGESQSLSKEKFIFTRPASSLESVTSTTGSMTFSKTAGNQLNPSLKVVGKNMLATEIVFSATNATSTVDPLTILAGCSFCSEYNISIPLATLQTQQGGITYKIDANDGCGKFTPIGFVTIDP